MESKRVLNIFLIYWRSLFHCLLMELLETVVAGILCCFVSSVAALALSADIVFLYNRPPLLEHSVPMSTGVYQGFPCREFVCSEPLLYCE